MGNNPMVRSTLTGVLLQVVMVVLGKFAPAVGTIPNFYAICGTLLAVVTGMLFSRSSPGIQGGQAAGGGAVAGGVSSLIGGVCAVATGQWPDFQLVQLAFPAISGALGGAIGGMIGRLLPKSAAA